MLKDQISIIPKPVSMDLGEGRFQITERTIIESHPKLIEIAEYYKHS